MCHLWHFKNISKMICRTSSVFMKCVCRKRLSVLVMACKGDGCVGDALHVLFLCNWFDCLGFHSREYSLEVQSKGKVVTDVCVPELCMTFCIQYVRLNLILSERFCGDIGFVVV